MSTCVVMSLTGPCVGEGCPAGRDAVSGCWGLTDWILRKRAQMQNVFATTYKIKIRLCILTVTTYFLAYV